MKTFLDDYSKNYFTNNLMEIKDELSLILILRSLFNEVIDLKIKAIDFIKIINFKFLE